jgi:hypothetical protein
MKCPKCGNHIESASKECIKCGIILAKYQKAQQRRQDEEIEKKVSIKLMDQKEDKVHTEPLDGPKNSVDIKKNKKELIQNRIKKLRIFSNKRILFSFTFLVIMTIGISYGYLRYQNEKQIQQQRIQKKIQQYIEKQRQRKKESYFKNLHIAKFLILFAAEKCKEVCETYSTAWSEAIANHKDFNSTIAIYSGVNSAFGPIDRIKELKIEIETSFKELDKYPDILPEAKKKLIEFFGVYSQLESLAQNPSGSLFSFNNKTHELQSNLISISNQLNVMLPQNKDIDQLLLEMKNRLIQDDEKFKTKQQEKFDEMLNRLNKLSKELEEKAKEKNRGK